MPDVLQYASPSKQGRLRFVKPVAAALSVAAVAISWTLAIWHWYLALTSYDPSRDSFPMDAFAADLTWFASGVTLAIGLGWVVFWWLCRRATARPE